MSHESQEFESPLHVDRRWVLRGFLAAGLSLVGSSLVVDDASAAQSAGEAEAGSSASASADNGNRVGRGWWVPAMIAGIGGGTLVARMRAMPQPVDFAPVDDHLRQPRNEQENTQPTRLGAS